MQLSMLFWFHTQQFLQKFLHTPVYFQKMVSYPNKISSAPVCNILNDCSLISKHFKMYITFDDIKGEKRIDLSYSIKNFDSAEIAVVSLFSNNIQYQLIKPCTIIDDISGDKN